MTYDDDFVRLNLRFGSGTAKLKDVGLEWPPPERLTVDHGKLRPVEPGDDPRYVMHRLSCSELTDEQRSGMTHVCRGAEYAYETEL